MPASSPKIGSTLATARQDTRAASTDVSWVRAFRHAPGRLAGAGWAAMSVRYQPPGMVISAAA
jgi:hypothetical protein